MTITAIMISIAAITGIGLVSVEAQTEQPTPDAMADITSQITDKLTTSNPPEVQLENINQAESMLFGKPVILATNGITETQTISADYDTMTGEIKGALLSCVDTNCTDSMVAATAKELADRISYWQEIKYTLEEQTMDGTCDINDIANTCLILDQGEEPTINGGITIGNDKIWNGWHREIRSPYTPITAYPQGFVQSENVITLAGPIKNGECSVVIKEIQGIKSIMRAVKIPIWQEPWTSRAGIIGYNTVWVVDFVPAEFVKNLNFCNANGSIQMDYEINVIIERQLLHFWKYLPAGYMGPAGEVPPNTR